MFALICARGGSKGIPRKNLQPLGGKPLIVWSVEQALAAKGVGVVLVSTDSEAIAAVARDAGASVPFLRPAELARDDTPEWEVWRHALSYWKSEGTMPDALLVVPPTAPLRSVEDIDACVAEFAKGGADIVVTVTDAHRSPYFNMVTKGVDGTVSLVIPPSGKIWRRQDALPVLDMTTVAYVADPDFVTTHDGIFAGRVRSVHVPVERALDIDTPLDLRIAEALVSTR